MPDWPSVSMVICLKLFVSAPILRHISKIFSEDSSDQWAANLKLFCTSVCRYYFYGRRKYSLLFSSYFFIQLLDLHTFIYFYFTEAIRCEDLFVADVLTCQSRPT